MLPSSASRRSLRTQRTSWLRRVCAATLALLMALPIGVGIVAPAFAAPGEFLQISKSVDKSLLAPGGVFTYTVQVTCSEEDCVNAVLADPLPAELEGFALQNVQFTASDATIAHTAVWTTSTGTSSTPPTAVDNATSVLVNIQQPIGAGAAAGVGLANGQTFTMYLTVAVPGSYPPGNSGSIVNTATTLADNATQVSASAPIVIDSAFVVDIDVSKTWTPTNQAFAPLAPSTIALSATNASNVSAETVVIQEPKAAPADAATLHASNPFTVATFTGFSSSAVAPECATVQVDAYVFDNGVWNWEEGSAAAALALPVGVAAEDVGGIRITCAGTIPVATGLDVEFGLAQRVDLVFGEHRVDNIATGTLTVTGQDPATDDAEASHLIAPVKPTVEAAKNLDPKQIGAGESSAATISATNGAATVSLLSLADPGFFTADVTFGGWVGGISWPDGATSGSVVYTSLGGDEETVPFTDGLAPAAPTETISGFALQFAGPIAPAATVYATFTINTTEAATGTELEVTKINTVTAHVQDANAQSAFDSSSDNLTIVAPGIETTLTKRVLPSTAVEPGEPVYVSLEANAQAITATSTVHDIAVEDVWAGDAGGFWNAFNLTAIAPTQVPAGTTLQIEVFDGAWTWIAGAPVDPSPQVVQLSESQYEAALDTAGVATGAVTGIRFSFHNAAGFAQDITVNPLAVFTARNIQRAGGATSPVDVEAPYENVATVKADGESSAGTDLEAQGGDTAVGTIVTRAGAPGPAGIEKQWLSNFVDAQSGDRESTRLSWSVTDGFSSVLITDSDGDHSSPSQTVFDAFDLTGISAIAANSAPFTNGWYLRYDTIQSIELWSASASPAGWVPVAEPAGGWIQNGSFVGLTLTDAQALDAQGIRITLAENGAARDAALLSGAGFDPFAPAAGSGVGASSIDRTFTLNWQLRDQARSDGRWVTADTSYNATDPAVVSNTTRLDATRPDASKVNDTDADTIMVRDQLPAVVAAKSASWTEAVHVPPVGTAPANYPTGTWTVTAKNNSVAPASYLRVTDPANCDPTSQPDCQLPDANANPFAGGSDWLTNPGGTTNPFDRFDLTGVSFSAAIPAEVSLPDSVVWLLRYDAGTFTYQQSTASVVAAMTPTELATVVGVSVTFQPANAGSATTQAGGTITSANTLTIRYNAVLRPTIRSTGVNQTLVAGQTFDVTNRVFAQSYDPVLSPGATTGDLKSVGVQLTGGVINITPTKTVAPDKIVIANPDVPVTVTLGANQGMSPRSTLSPSVVTIEDQADSPEFWNTFDFTGLGTVALPAGATQVRVDAYGPFGTGGALAWLEGTASATAVMPVGAGSFPDVQGIRFVFTNGDSGAFFSSTVPAPNWAATATFTAQLRDTYRDSGDDVVFAGTINNEQTSIATRTDGNNTARKASADIVTLDLGTRELSVNKLTNNGIRTASVGENVPFRLTVANTGTGYLTLDSVTDTLPPELVWLGTVAPVYTAAATGTLSTDVTLTVAPDGRTLTFTWPDGGKTMQPGEVFTIDLRLELQPGLPAGVSATNTMTAATAEVLERCGNTNSPQQGTTGAWAQDQTTCGTTDVVRPIAGPNLFTVKGVRGSFAGAIAPGRPDITCAPTLEAGGGSFYRAPCVANSVVGGVDDWVLRAANAGTYTVQNMVIFDQLPTPGDQSLISGSARGSQFRPELVADTIDVTAPIGTVTTIEVTTSPNVCNGTWTGLITQAPCEQAGESWTAVNAATDWSAVTGIRVSLDFAALAGGGLVGGQLVDVTYSTRNLLESTTSPLGAPATVPASDVVAINQHGVKYTDEAAVKKIAPATVGVQLLTGSIEVRKIVSGAAAAYAPDTFTAAVQCEVGGVQLDLGGSSTVSLSSANAYTARFDGIPYSVATPPECTIAETGNPGEFGEAARSIDPAGGVIVIREPSTAADPTVPTAHVATITNDYRFSGLSVTKTVDTEATSVTFGPFTFTLSCLSGIGDAVDFDGNGQTTLEFSLRDGETFTAPANSIPERSQCTLTETDGLFADTVAIVGDNTVDNGNSSATIVMGDDPAAVLVTNGYDAGTLTVAKVVDGQGADAFGVGTFRFSASCVYQGQQLLDAEFELVRNATRSFGVYPAGTECSVVETGVGGATTTAITPTNGAVVIPAPTGADNVGAVTVTATNTFDVGSVDVVKNVVGDGASLYGAGPFTAQVYCTWDRDGVDTAVNLAADGIITLSEGNGYRASVDHVVAGADCEVTETSVGGATSTSVQPAGGAVRIGAAGSAAPVVTITNVFDVTSIEVTKQVQGNLQAAGATGPFTVELVCTWPVNGQVGDVTIPDGGTRELTQHNGYAAAFEMLPVGASCALTETETGGADSTAMTVLVDGSDRVDVRRSTAEVDISTTTAPGQARVIVTNAFDAALVLPRTGADVTFVVMLMTVLVSSGIVLLVASRRGRRRARHL